MSTNAKTHLLDIPIGGNDGEVWNRLHSEREDICEAMLKDSQRGMEAEVLTDQRPGDMSATNWHLGLLQARLKKVDDALDRLMSGSYGSCSKCGKWIEDTKLAYDPAIEFCLNCWDRESKQYGTPILSHSAREANPSSELTPIALPLETLQPYDTVLVRTVNTDYRILLLDPKTGRALIEGGRYLTEPREGSVAGSKLHDSIFTLGSIVMGHHLELWVGKRIICTSPVQSISIEHHNGAESAEAISAAIH